MFFFFFKKAFHITRSTKPKGILSIKYSLLYLCVQIVFGFIAFWRHIFFLKTKKKNYMAKEIVSYF